MFGIDVEHTDSKAPVVILRLKGSFDTAALDIFEPIVKDELRQGARNVLIDLGGLTFMSSIGIRAITSLYYDLHPESSGEAKGSIMEGIRTGDYTAPHLKLLNPPKEVQRVLEMTGLDMVLESFSDEGTALQSF